MVSLRKASLLALIGILGLLLLAACSNNTSSAISSTNGNSSSSSAQAITKLIVLVNKPKAKMVNGTTFEVDGQVKNGDAKQHDITLQATLLDASGKAVGTATQLVDNVPGNTIENYAIQGTTSQPSWTSVQLTIIKVTENIDGSGTD